MASVAGTPWSKHELVFVLKLYCVTAFGRLHSRNPDIIAAAKQLGRTPSSVALKLTNFASLDPTIERRGMANASRMDKEVWDEFFNNMDEFLRDDGPPAYGSGAAEPVVPYFDGTRAGIDVLRTAKARVNQDFFRNLVLTSYDYRCALSGINAPELLVASHIVPWSVDPVCRTNPRNGICLSPLHDRAFDAGLISFGEDFSVLYSVKMSSATRKLLGSLTSEKLRLPTRFIPDQTFLEYHRTNIFLG